METTSIDVKPVSRQSDPRLAKVASDQTTNADKIVESKSDDQKPLNKVLDTVSKIMPVIDPRLGAHHRPVLSSLDNTNQSVTTSTSVENMDDTLFFDLIGIGQNNPIPATNSVDPLMNTDLLNSPTTFFGQLIDKALHEK